MPTRILALIPEARTASACLDVAEAAAAALEEARMEALHVVVDPAQLAAPAEEIDMQILREKREGTAAQRAEATGAVFEQWVRDHPSAPVSPAWKQIAGAEQSRICEEARTFDVLVVPRGTNADGVEALQAALYCAGRPFFLVPRTLPAIDSRGIEERIVIAWNDTPACRRATEGVLPWLKRSRQSAVLLINEGDEVAADLTGKLVSAGVRYTIVSVARDDEKLGDQIVSEAKRFGATLLVMGAHRHNMLIEWLVGHTTDQVIAHEDLLLFMAH